MSPTSVLMELFIVEDVICCCVSVAHLFLFQSETVIKTNIVRMFTSFLGVLEIVGNVANSPCTNVSIVVPSQTTRLRSFDVFCCSIYSLASNSLITNPSPLPPFCWHKNWLVLLMASLFNPTSSALPLNKWCAGASNVVERIFNFSLIKFGGDERVWMTKIIQINRLCRVRALEQLAL